MLRSWVATLVAALIAPLAAQAQSMGGFIPSAVRIHSRMPQCISVEAGGPAGPGTGATLRNDCAGPLTITGVAMGDGAGGEVRQVRLESIVFDGKGLERSVLFGAHDGLECRLGALPHQVEPGPGPACGTVNSLPCASARPVQPQRTTCKTLALEPGQSVLMFVRDRFRIVGTDGLLVDGRAGTDVRIPK